MIFYFILYKLFSVYYILRRTTSFFFHEKFLRTAASINSDYHMTFMTFIIMSKFDFNHAILLLLLLLITIIFINKYKYLHI